MIDVASWSGAAVRAAGEQIAMSLEDLLRLKAPGVMQRPEKPREEADCARLLEEPADFRGGKIGRRVRPVIPLNLAKSLVFEAQHPHPSDFFRGRLTSILRCSM
jgi:hypothetical protein